ILESPSSQFLKDLVRRDPLGVGRMLLGRLLMGKGALKLNPIDGYYMSEDGSSLLILVKPERPAQNLGYTASLVARIRAAEGEARAKAGLDAQSLAALKVEY